MIVKDSQKLFLLLTLLLGGIVRFMPVAMAGFPVNDGGMFYNMVEELQANHFLLPTFTQYNLADIPYAYPPFGFYITGLVSSLFRIPALDVVRWLPLLVSTLSLLAFYLLADELLRSKTQAALATLFYSLLPASFGWAVMGGGITRSFGLLFLFLTIAYANRLFTRTSGLHAVLTAIFGALAFLSHPETGLQAAAACILLWIFRERSKKTLLWSVAVALGVIVLSAPWWGTVLANHGWAPIRSAMASSNDGTASAWVSLVTLQFSDGVFYNLTVALGLVGLLGMLARREFFFLAWLVLPFIVDPRSADGIALMPIAMLAGYSFDQILAPALLSLRKLDKEWLSDRFVTITLFVMAFYLFFGVGVYGIGLAENSLSTADREIIAWVDENIPPGEEFLLLTGEQYSMKDPFQEWFPALTEQRSHTTLQGKEWTLAENFFPFYGELVALQHCADVACIEAWGERTELEHQYLLIKKLPEESPSPLQASLTLLYRSISSADQYVLIYDADNAAIFSK
jgi:hypothetical protein